MPSLRQKITFGHYALATPIVGLALFAFFEPRPTGGKIAADVPKRIFAHHFTTKEVGKGSGLGLFIAFEIIEEHGGCMTVESQPGTGTASHIRLPATAIDKENGNKA